MIDNVIPVGIELVALILLVIFIWWFVTIGKKYVM